MSYFSGILARGSTVSPVTPAVRSDSPLVALDQRLEPSSRVADAVAFESVADPFSAPSIGESAPTASAFAVGIGEGTVATGQAPSVRAGEPSPAVWSAPEPLAFRSSPEGGVTVAAGPAAVLGVAHGGGAPDPALTTFPQQSPVMSHLDVLASVPARVRPAEPNARALPQSIEPLPHSHSESGARERQFTEPSTARASGSPAQPNEHTTGSLTEDPSYPDPLRRALASVEAWMRQPASPAAVSERVRSNERITNSGVPMGTSPVIPPVRRAAPEPAPRLSIGRIEVEVVTPAPPAPVVMQAPQQSSAPRSSLSAPSTRLSFGLRQG